LEDLDHTKAYQWAIKWEVPQNQVITSAKLTFYDIYNWARENNDKLWMKVLDYDDLQDFNRKPGIRSDSKPSQQAWWRTTDNELYGNAFAQKSGVDIGCWTDPDDNRSSTAVLPFDIPATAFELMSDGLFAIALDPDCHYYNSKIKLEITTGEAPHNPPSVPEGGSTALLLGLGALATSFFGSRRKQ